MKCFEMFKFDLTAQRRMRVTQKDALDEPYRPSRWRECTKASGHAGRWAGAVLNAVPQARF
jgi:hypothetical protein